MYIIGSTVACCLFSEYADVTYNVGLNSEALGSRCSGDSDDEEKEREEEKEER